MSREGSAGPGVRSTCGSAASMDGSRNPADAGKAGAPGSAGQSDGWTCGHGGQPRSAGAAWRLAQDPSQALEAGSRCPRRGPPRRRGGP